MLNTDAYSLALRRLTARDYSSKDLNTYLVGKGFSAEDCAEVIAALVRDRFLDDRRYAAALSRMQARRGKGPTYIRGKLKQKGVDLSIEEIRSIVAESEGKSELQRAIEIVERRYPGFKQDKATAVKAVQALVRRGFAFEVARRAVGAPSAVQVGEE